MKTTYNTNEELIDALIRAASDNNEFNNEDKIEAYRDAVLKRMKKHRSKKKEQKFKTVPRFWWDYSGDAYTKDVSVVVESSLHNGHVAKFNNENIEIAIAEAESLIQQLERGNISLKNVMEKFQLSQANSDKLSQCHQFGLCADAVKTGDTSGLLTTCDICPRNKQ